MLIDSDKPSRDVESARSLACPLLWRKRRKTLLPAIVQNPFSRNLIKINSFSPAHQANKSWFCVPTKFRLLFYLMKKVLAFYYRWKREDKFAEWSFLAHNFTWQESFDGFVRSDIGLKFTEISMMRLVMSGSYWVGFYTWIRFTEVSQLNAKRKFYFPFW